MKTLEEVKAHVNVVGYNQIALQKIEGFLLGNGLLGDDYEMEYMIGERTFDDFRTWFNGEEHQETPIDWSEFGFGDFIHVQEGIDVILLGGIHDEKIVCVNDRCEVKRFVVTDETRPCNEEEIYIMIKRLNTHGLNFCLVDNEFKPCPICNSCTGCKKETENSREIEELNNSFKELCEIANSMGEDNPFKGIAKSIVKSIGAMVNEVNECDKDDSSIIDELEIDAKEAIENIIANLHSGELSDKETKSVIDALNVLVELGKMYE